MEKREDIRNEILEISKSVAAIGNANIYSVPQGYFTNLAEEIMGKIREEVFLPLVASPFKAPPDNYFEGLAGNIMAKIKTSEVFNEVSGELQTVAPLLNTISKQNVYTVPEGYFNNFSVNVNTVEKGQAKVISLANRSRNWLAYAAAAVLTGVVVTGAYLFMNRGATNIQANHQYTITNVSQNISNLSDGEIIHYLSTQPEVDIATTSIELNNSNTDIQTILNNMSDEEIQHYLKTNKEPGDKPIKGI